MKRLSIRLQVTLWYAALMTLLAAATLTAMFAAGERLVRTSSENMLIAAVDSARSEWHEGTDQGIGENLTTFRDGVYLLYYDEEGNLLSAGGTRPGDNCRGHHADVLALDDRAYIFYFVHPGAGEYGYSGEDEIQPYAQRRSVLQVAQLTFSAGKLCCDRDKPCDLLLPGLSLS